MTDPRQPFDLRQNEDFIFCKELWWMSNWAMTTGGVVVALAGFMAVYVILIRWTMGVAQAWIGQ